MISKLLIRITRYAITHRRIFYIALILSTLLLAYGISRLTVSESIADTLPKASSFTQFQKLLSDSKLDTRVVFAVTVPEEADPDALYEKVRLFEDTLREVTADYLTDIRAFRETIDSEVLDYVLNHLPELIDADYYTHLSEQIQPDAIRASVSSVRNRLSTPEGAWLKELLLKDPLGFTYPFFSAFRESAGMAETSIENGMVLINDGKHVLVTAQTAFPTGDSKNENRLFEKLESFKTNWNTLHPDYKLHYFGGFALAASNSNQIKSDSMLTMSLALILIFALIWAYYRDFKTSVIILLPAVFGGLFATGMLGYLHPEVSGIAMAMGAVLLGIALDYSIHFVSHFRNTGSIDKTLRDISAPLITGSATTILAYSALIFANSGLLRDFGLFAGLALSSALLFTLIALPVILQLTGAGAVAASARKPLFQLPEIPRKLSLPILAGIGALTLLFYYVADDVKFDGDPRNISVHPPALSESEKLLTPIDPETDVQLFIFASETPGLKAEEANTAVYQTLLQLKKSGRIKTFGSAAPFVVSDSLRRARVASWNNYWKHDARGQQVAQHLRSYADQNGFSSDAFADFEQRILSHSSATASQQDTDSLIRGLGIENLVQNHQGRSTFITTVVAGKEHLETVKAALPDLPGVQLFYRMEMVESLLEVVKEDFNYILFVSGSIVFLALLLLYGRLELALLSFMPMVISWIWILGTTVLLDVKFNFVNVVFATFIFGLGDDFSIFMTDGLLQRYKRGRNKLSSYTSAISLSGLTVLIGTGVLLFASHPALKSIAVVSVPGIICIVVISLVFQPIVFNLFIQNRVDKGRTPISIWTFLKTWFCFTFFLAMCLLAFLAMVVLILLPVRKKTKKEWLAKIMSILSTAVMYSGTQIRKRTYGRELLDYQKPAVLIANHSSFLDIMIMLMHHPKAVIMVKEWVYKSPLYGWVIRYANYLFMEDGPEANTQQAMELVNDGYSIIVFPEGTRSEDGKLRRFHKGAFYLADRLNIPIQPVLIHGAGYVSPKNELVIKHGSVNVKILPRIAPSDNRWGESFQQRTKTIASYFKKELASFQKEMDDTRFLKQRIFNNYIFKGPVLEWYFRIKWELEKKNYERYDQLIENRKKVLDLGCGYGFLSFYLHYRDESRQIVAVDYDEEKIEIAANAYGKSVNLQFVQADISTFPFEKQDVIFLNDVLHYLPEDKQRALLNRCIEALNPAGMLFIRDGVTDNVSAHQNTRFTEWLSTKIFSFNKKDDHFHFFAKDDIRRLAATHQLEIMEEAHSKQTSNMLFILRKKPV